MPNPRISFERLEERGIAIMLRITRADDGSRQSHLLSRKSGVWIRITAEQIVEHSIPSECLFPADELPESVENSDT
jgi:hypothetical protein